MVEVKLITQSPEEFFRTLEIILENQAVVHDILTEAEGDTAFFRSVADDLVAVVWPKERVEFTYLDLDDWHDY